MTNTIEREIVSISLDTKELSKGVNTSVKEVDRLKKSLDLDGVSKKSFEGLKNLSKVDFNPMGQSIEAVGTKINLMGVAAAAVVFRITNAIIDMGKQITNALIVDPIKTGLEEYETQLNAVQTILANTQKKGTTLEDVNDALDELNRYADLTIYNFTQMTENIGKFTAAGVDLDTSVSAIKGIANVAALSGSSAVQASTAMYQLSQAIASGVVRLQDWNSVQNAGMGGQVFQDALIETARLYDENIDKMIEKSGGFRNSLQENWLTAQILTETLTKFTGDLSREQLIAMGYTEQQAEEIFKMAETANDAATKIKTFTQLIDTMKEALQSGWSATWRIILGDFEEAKELWGSIAGVLGGMIDASSDARNSMLELWAASGGRTALIEGFMNILEAGVNILTAFREAVAEIFAPLDYVDLFQITFAFLQFSETLKESSTRLGPFKTIVTGLAAVLDIVKIALLAVLDPIIEYIRTLGPAAESFSDFIIRIAEAITEFRTFAKETGFFDQVVADVIAGLTQFIDKIIEMAQQLGELEVIDAIVTSLQSITREDLVGWWESFIDVLNSFIDCVVKVARKISDLAIQFYELDVVQDALQWLRSIEREDCIVWWNRFLDVVTPVVETIKTIAREAKRLYGEFVKLEIVQDFSGYMSDLELQDIVDGLKSLVSGVKNFLVSIKDSELVQAFFAYLQTFDGRRIMAFLDEAKERFGGFSGAIAIVQEKISGLIGSFGKLNTSIGGSGGGGESPIAAFFQELVKGAENIDYGKLFDNIIKAINTGLLASIVLALRKGISGSFITDIIEKLVGNNSAIGKIGKSLAGIFDTLDSSLGTLQNNVKADTIQKIAISIGILAGSLVLLTLVDGEKLTQAAGAIAVMTATLFGSAGALSAIKTQDSVKAAVAVTGLAAAMLIASSALVKLSKLDPEQIRNGLAAMTGGLLALVGSMKVISSGVGATKSTVALFAIVGSLYYLIDVIERFGELEPDVLSQGILGLSAALGAMVGTLLVLSKAGSSGSMISAGVGILNLASGLFTLAFAVDKFGNFDPSVLQQGLMSVAAVLVGFGVFSRLIKPQGLLATGAALIIVGFGLQVMADALAIFGNIGIEQLQQGLIGMAGALTLVVIAANLMTGAIAGAAATLVMASAILVLGLALTVISAIPFEGILLGLAGLAATFVVLGVAGLLMAPLVPVLLGLGIAMLLFGAAAALLGVGILAASSGLVALAAAGAAVGGAIAIVGAAIIQIIPQIGTAIANGMTNFLQTIATNMPKILAAWETILLGLLEATIGMIPEMVAAIMDMVTQLLEAIASRLPDLIQAGFDILLAFIQGIEDNIAEVVAAGLGVLTEFLNGIAEGLPDLVDSAFNVILTFLNSIAGAIEEYMPKILAAGARIGTALLEGLGQAIQDGAEAIIGAILSLAQTAVDRFKAFWGIESPSTLMYDMMGYILQGFINGARDMSGDVGDVITEFFGKVRDGLVPLLNSMMDDVNNDISFDPIISPVMDLDNVNRGADAINSLFGGRRAVDALFANDYGYSGNGATNGSTSVNKSVSFVQNLYSPKALDRATIYRQSNTYAAKLGLLEL